MRTPSAIESHREFITSSINSGATIGSVRKELGDRGISTTVRTLQRYLRAWSVSRPPSVGNHRELITELHAKGATQAEIREALRQQGCDVSRMTLYRQLTAWNLKSSKVSNFEDSEELRARIKSLVRETRETDSEIASLLELEGFTIGERRVRRIRLELNLPKWQPRSAHESLSESTVSALRVLLDSGRIEDWGREHVYTYMRSEHGIFGRDRMFQQLKGLDAEGIKRRSEKRRLKRYYNTVRTPGPNFAWSIDGHCKLEAFGIQIYAAIDVFSRKIQWFYCGLTGRTAASVLKQYLNTVASSGIMPQILKADRGAETTGIGDAHLELSRRVQRRLAASGELEGEVPPQELAFEDCFHYGTSKMNSRIEGWWAQMAKSTSRRILHYFQELRERREFVEKDIVDQISFLAIYMPLLREELDVFVSQWNKHRIRRQSQNEGVISGIPNLLYNYPSRVSAQPCGLEALPDDYESLFQGLEDYDIMEYLPADTSRWCNDTLLCLGFELPLSFGSFNPENGQRTHREAYLKLRHVVRQHMSTQQEPILGLCPSKAGLRRWQPSIDE